MNLSPWMPIALFLGATALPPAAMSAPATFTYSFISTTSPGQVDGGGYVSFSEVPIDGYYAEEGGIPTYAYDSGGNPIQNTLSAYHFGLGNTGLGQGGFEYAKLEVKGHVLTKFYSSMDRIDENFEKLFFMKGSLDGMTYSYSSSCLSISAADRCRDAPPDIALTGRIVYDVVAVPEPATYALLFGGLTTVAGMARRRKGKQFTT